MSTATDRCGSALVISLLKNFLTKSILIPVKKRYKNNLFLNYAMRLMLFQCCPFI